MKLILKILGIGTALLIIVIGLILFYMIRRGRVAAQNQEIMKTEFAVGKPSESFFTRARELGADDFVLKGPGESMSSPGKYVPVPRWSDQFEKQWSELDHTFRSLPKGSAEIQITGIPPFQRFYVQIEFEGGKVTSIRTSDLD
jgi:hypothetical protein